MSYLSHQTLLRVYCVLEGVKISVATLFISVPKDQGIGQRVEATLRNEKATMVHTLDLSLHFKWVITMLMMSPSTSKCKTESLQHITVPGIYFSVYWNRFSIDFSPHSQEKCDKRTSSFLKKISLLTGKFILVSLTSNGMSSHRTVVCSVIEILILAFALPSKCYAMTK